MNTKAVEPKTKLKIHVNKSLAIEPPELAGFYVDSVFLSLGLFQELMWHFLGHF